MCLLIPCPCWKRGHDRHAGNLTNWELESETSHAMIDQRSPFPSLRITPAVLARLEILDAPTTPLDH